MTTTPHTARTGGEFVARHLGPDADGLAHILRTIGVDSLEGRGRPDGRPAGGCYPLRSVPNRLTPATERFTGPTCGPRFPRGRVVCSTALQRR